MAKKDKVSINMLERYVKAKAAEEDELSIQIDKENELTFHVKPRLSLKECVEFIEEVVNEYVDKLSVSIVPIARDYIFNRCVMTYYANFTMPKNEEAAFAFVSGSKEIIGMIKEHIDMDQYLMLYDCITEKIKFETRKMLTTQEMRVDHALLEIEDFTERVADLFDGVDGEQIANFITSMNAISQSGEITPQEIANAIVNNTVNKDE